MKTLTAKGTVLASEKRDFTVLLTKFAFIVTFEEFLVLNSKNPFKVKCLINNLFPLASITEENNTVQREILNYSNIFWYVHTLAFMLNRVVELDFCSFLQA